MPSGDLDEYFREHTNERLAVLESKYEKGLVMVIALVISVLIQIGLNYFGINAR